MASQEEYKDFEYSLLTDGIEVNVRPFYAEELSQPSIHKYVFVYKVRIKNFTENKVQLMSREWHIVEGDGTKYNVNGEGVVGKQPILDVNEEFEYASQAILFENNGMMFGSYNFKVIDTNSEMNVKIPPFSLDIQSYHNDNFSNYLD